MVLPIFAVTAAVPAPSAANDVAADALHFVKRLGNDAIELLGSKSLSAAERNKRFRSLLIQGFDVPAIGRFVLGRYWREATEEERQEYQSLFEDLIVATYAGRFAEYTGETFTLYDARPDDNSQFIIVASQIDRPSGASIRVDWRVMKTGSSYAIVDVAIEGISMSITQRSEFAAVIQRSGGKIRGLLAALRDKTKELRPQ
jgi:phospholipid transport system substrate-binding protein